mmetsp:Transcript_1521/g.4603  ORF Transcript_1521/g.4603 Transcript_1521/m.4603 type:complete len:207 (+) Transcript_1521:518-1138(+)
MPGAGGAGGGLSALLSPLVARLLEHHAEMGDTQTCAVLSRVLELAITPPPSPQPPPGLAPSVAGGGKADAAIEKLAPRASRRRWTVGYLEELRRQGDFASACEVVKHCGDTSLQQAAARSTTVLLGGRQRGRPLCGVCELPVRGSYIWCQGCGHGGHLAHMRNWFETEVECPTGCGHRCQIRLLAPSPPQAQAAVCAPCGAGGGLG